MNFERSDILRPILDALATDDQNLFNSLQQRVFAEQSGRGMLMSTATVELVFQAFRDKLTERGEKIVSEIRRVLTGAYIEDFDDLAEALKAEWTTRMGADGDLASSELRSVPPMLMGLSNLPSAGNRLANHLAQLKKKCLAEIELFCTNLHDSQAPRLFLNVGEVFAGNRAARAIFTGAKQSIDIIDAYLGPAVFDMLEVSPASIPIRLISDKADSGVKLTYNLFNQQFNNRASFRLCDRKDIHDRFIIIDDARALHLGASIKDLGKSDSLIDTAGLDPHKKRFEELWLKGTPVV